MWNIFVLISIVIVIGLIGLNVKSLIMKCKHTESKFDLFIGILISLIAVSVLIHIFIDRLNQ
jgi:hypothetical protein